MSALVVDADVALKWHLRQDGSEQAKTIARRAIELHAPEFQFLEVSHVLAKYVRGKLIETEFARDAARQHRKLIEYWHENTRLAPTALDLATLHSHPFYDCLYLALALRLDAQVVTADKAFASRFSAGKHAGRVVLLADFAAPAGTALSQPQKFR